MIRERINKYYSSESLNNMLKLWLITMLFIMPYQFEIMNHFRPLSMKLITIIRLLDEITLVMCFPIALHKIFHERIKYKHLFPLLFTLIVFSIIGLLSGVINMNSLIVTSHGVFYYIKYFLLIFIYAVFFKSFSDFNKIFRVLLITAVIVGFVAFLQEVLALLIRHVLEDSANESAISIINSIVINITRDNLLRDLNNWRLGAYRASSMMSHYNLLGFYSLFILTLYLYTSKQIKPFYLLSLISGIYFSVSRVALAGLIILCIVQAMKGRKLMIIFMLIPMCIFISFGTLSEFKMKDKQMMSEVGISDGQRVEYNMTYRHYGRSIAMEIWKDHPFWGVGPGMFGGKVASKSRSPFYEEYNFAPHLQDSYSDLDQFWPQAFAETGIIGTTVFINIYIYLLLITFIYKRLALTLELKNYIAGLGLITVFVFINTFASSLNIVSILYPYCALSGMGIGIAVNELS